MCSNNKHTVEELEKYIQLFLKDEVSFQEVKNNYGLLLSKSTFRFKVFKYHDSKVFKNSVVEGHPELDTLISGLACKYNIPL